MRYPELFPKEQYPSLKAHIKRHTCVYAFCNSRRVTKDKVITLDYQTEFEAEPFCLHCYYFKSGSLSRYIGERNEPGPSV